MPARPSTLHGRRALITLFAAAGVVLTSTPALAAPGEPATSAEAAGLIAQKGHELEVVTEQFNTAREELASDQAAAAQAAAEAQVAQDAETASQASVTSVARSAYTGGNQLASLQAMLTSESAGDFVDQMATLDLLSAHNTDVLTVARSANVAATATQQEADRTAAAAQTQLDSVTSQQNSLNVQIADYQAQYEALSAAERAAAEAAAAAAAAQAAAEQAAADQAAAAASSSADSGSSSSTNSGSNGSASSGSSGSGSSSSAGSSSSSAGTSSSSSSSSRAGNSSSAGTSSSSSRPAVAAPAAPAAAPAPGGSGAGQTAVSVAMGKRGSPYVWAASGPGSFDCSGLVQYAYAAAGISLPHSSGMQARSGTGVSRSQLQPGDLIAFYSPVSHIGIYIGNGQMVHAPTSGDVVKVGSIDSMGSITAMRRLG